MLTAALGLVPLSDVHALWSVVSIRLLESVSTAFHLKTWVPMTIVTLSLLHSSHFSVKHVCFAHFVPFNKSVFNNYFRWEVSEKSGDILSFPCHPFSISGFLISLPQGCTLLFTPDELKSSTATKIDTQSPCAQTGRSAHKIINKSQKKEGNGEQMLYGCMLPSLPVGALL